MANNLNGSSPIGLFQLTGGANSAGYMGPITSDFQSLFGGAKFFTGWSSVYSITSRYSQGPFFWTFDPRDMQRSTTGTATAWINTDIITGILMNGYLPEQSSGSHRAR